MMYTHTYIHTYIHTYSTYTLHILIRVYYDYAHSYGRLHCEVSRRFDSALVRSTGPSPPFRGTPGSMPSRHLDAFRKSEDEDR